MNDPHWRERQSAIRKFYADRAGLLSDPNEWGIDAYEWERLTVYMTPIEAALWHDIREQNVVLYPQFPVGPYFVDFGNPAAKVAIECDGVRWHLDKQKDAARQRAIEAMGWTVYRITGRDCFTEPEETEDEYGNPVYTSSIAYRFVKSIAERHGIKRLFKREPAVHVFDALLSRYSPKEQAA